MVAAGGASPTGQGEEARDVVLLRAPRCRVWRPPTSRGKAAAGAGGAGDARPSPPGSGGHLNAPRRRARRADPGGILRSRRLRRPGDQGRHPARARAHVTGLPRAPGSRRPPGRAAGRGAPAQWRSLVLAVAKLERGALVAPPIRPRPETADGPRREGRRGDAPPGNASPAHAPPAHAPPTHASSSRDLDVAQRRPSRPASGTQRPPTRDHFPWAR